MEQLTLDGGAVPICTASERDLVYWCHLANMIAFSLFGCRNSCIATSHALAAFLRDRGLDAEPFRAEVHVYTPDRSATGFSLGSQGDGSRRPAAGPGLWRGHLAVMCAGFVLDPTIDQSECGGKRVQPAVFPMPAGWADGTRYRWKENGLDVSYSRYYRQVGWKSAPAARPTQWRELLLWMQDLATTGRVDRRRHA